MPPKGYTRRGGGAGGVSAGGVATAAVAVTGKKHIGATAAFGLTGEDETLGLPAQLQQLQQRREALESQLGMLDLRVYDLETVYLRQFVELGGCLFDGFSLERQKQWSGATTSATTGSPAAAYRARLHRFTPNDRVFTASSVGALGVVERLKTCKAARAGATGGRRKRSRTES